ncbi:hypothetical protein [Roseivirga pacifica]|uniref:hypothetical protein n=1 Tax=Roseivirga pacifica TaxID=1267423 RepID=UPI003BAF8201
MKKTLFLLIIVFLSGISLNAQSARQIADDYLKATGGKEQWKSLQNRRITMGMKMQGFEFPAVMYEAKGNKQRLEINVEGVQIIQAFDGEVAWVVSPPQGITQPTAMTGPQAESAKEYEFLGEFIDSESRGIKLEYKGEEEADGKTYWHVDVTKKSGTTEEYYFDKETKLIAFMKTPGANGQMSTTFYSDYKAFDGIKYPTHLVVKTGGMTVQELTFTKVEHGVDIDPSIFSMPGN